MKTRNALLFFCFGLLTWIGGASAHDLVLIPTAPDTLTLKFGHPHEYQVPNSEKLIQLNAYVQGQKAPISVLNGFKGSGADSATVDLTKFTNSQDVMIVSGQYDNGYFTTAGGNQYFNTTKLHIPAVKDSGNFFKFAKALFPPAEDGAFARNLGEQLEILPVTDPFKVQPGQKLPVKILYQGQPLANVGVEIGDGQTQLQEQDIPRYKTDASGVADVPIAKPGLQIIAVDYQTRPRFPALSDHDDYSATVAFIVKDRQ